MRLRDGLHPAPAIVLPSTPTKQPSMPYTIRRLVLFGIPRMPQTVYTVGHSTHTTAHLLTLLHQHAITAVADVRATPFSRHNPHFNQPVIKAAIQAAGMAYVYLGSELGARTTDPACERDGKIAYDLIAQTPLFQAGLARVAKGAERYTVALMCAEADPLVCHRTILVCRHLEAMGFTIQHILPSGQLVPQADLLDRARTALRLPPCDLLRTPADMVQETCRRQGDRIAFTFQ